MSITGCPHSYVIHHYVCDSGVPAGTSDVTVSDSGAPIATSLITTSDMGVPTATLDLTISVILASPQLHQTPLRLWYWRPLKLRHTLLRQTSLCLWFGCPHSHVTTSDMGVPTDTLHVTMSDMHAPTVTSCVTLWFRCPQSYVICQCVFDSGIPTATSYITMSVIRVSSQPHQTSLHLWFGRPHSYIRRHSLWFGRPHSHVRRHYVCDADVSTATSDVTMSVIWASPQLHYRSMLEVSGGNEAAYNHHQELPPGSLWTTATCAIHVSLRAVGLTELQDQPAFKVGLNLAAKGDMWGQQTWSPVPPISRRPRPFPASCAIWLLLSCLITLGLPVLGVLLPRPDAKDFGLFLLPRALGAICPQWLWLLRAVGSADQISLMDLSGHSCSAAVQPWYGLVGHGIWK